MKDLRNRVAAEVSKVVVGQDDVVDLLLAAVSVSGHVLLEGVPGTAKTLLANAASRALAHANGGDGGFADRAAEPELATAPENAKGGTRP